MPWFPSCLALRASLRILVSGEEFSVDESSCLWIPACRRKDSCAGSYRPRFHVRSKGETNSVPCLVKSGLRAHESSGGSVNDFNRDAGPA